MSEAEVKVFPGPIEPLRLEIEQLRKHNQSTSLLLIDLVRRLERLEDEVRRLDVQIERLWRDR